MRKIIVIYLLLLCGCASVTQSRLDNIQKDFSNGNFASIIDREETDENLDLLIKATALFHGNKFKESDEIFEEFNKKNIDETSSSISRETTSLLFGGGVNSYKPYMMDSLFVSYYQLWDLLALSDWLNARVVINQSYERQKNMSIKYKKLLEENKNKIFENSEITETINKNKSDWAAFSDIMNPALMYLSGIYFLNDGDFENAEIYLKRANGMMPENDFIKTDLNLAQRHIVPKDITWIFTESGFAPRLREENAGIFLPNIGMIYFSFSEPYFNSTPPKPKNAEILADIDKMFLTEYNEYRINEILRSYASAVSKATLQSTMYNSHSDTAPILGILSTIYTISSSNTDVRTWATLPKYIYVQRIDRTKTNLNEINVDGNMKTEIKRGDNNLIYIRQPNEITDTKFIELNQRRKHQ